MVDMVRSIILVFILVFLDTWLNKPESIYNKKALKCVFRVRELYGVYRPFIECPLQDRID
jgi:hypothetical protein